MLNLRMKLYGKNKKASFGSSTYEPKEVSSMRGPTGGWPGHVFKPADGEIPSQVIFFLRILKAHT